MESLRSINESPRSNLKTVPHMTYEENQIIQSIPIF